MEGGVAYLSCGIINQYVYCVSVYDILRNTDRKGFFLVFTVAFFDIPDVAAAKSKLVRPESTGGFSLLVLIQGTPTCSTSAILEGSSK